MGSLRVIEWANPLVHFLQSIPGLRGMLLYNFPSKIPLSVDRNWGYPVML